VDFFQSQQLARRNTTIMLVLFVVAVVAIVAAVDLVSAFAYHVAMSDQVPRGQRVSVPAGLHVAVVIGTLGVIFAVSAWKAMELSAGGGAAVAKMVNARRVLPSSADPLERRLLNVVEEMSLAAGTRLPGVYVMDEEHGINAFAAGSDVSNSIVAVTRGTLETLNRDELQGVIAHEFSHIVNGDVSLNIRMIGVLAGIVFLGAIGQFMVRSTSGSDGKAAGAIAGVGFGLLVIGYIGLFCARLIKATVSRQREFLADAASVQFTRNPDGIAGALDQIRASTRQSLIDNRNAENVSHLFFGQGVKMKFEGLFATHPPLDQRIERIRPGFQGSAYRQKRPAASDVPALDDSIAAPPEGAMGFNSVPVKPGEIRASDRTQQWGKSAAESVQLVGALDATRVDRARKILEAIPKPIQEMVRDPAGAQAAIVAMLLANHDVVMDEQLTAAKTAGVGQVAQSAALVAKVMRQIEPAYYMSIIDLALPALKMASPDDQRSFLLALQAVIHADRRVSLLEFVVFNLVLAQLQPRRGIPAAKYKTLEERRADIEVVLSLMAHAGCDRGPEAEAQFTRAFDAGAKEMALAGLKPISKGLLTMDKAGDALGRLRDLAPMAKAVLIKGLFATVTADGTIKVVEASIMRAVGAVLDCPLPPLLEDADPAMLAT
jgi:Zn-dependent protease with chaperone function